MQSEKRISILTSEYSGSKKWIAILLSECPGSQKWISICVSGHSVKWKMNYDFAFGVFGKAKMNCDFAFWVLRKAKMNFDFASQSVRKPKMNCDFASLSVRSRQNELRFCFPECLWSKIEIYFELHFIRWIGDNNLLNLRLRLRLYAPHFVSLIDEWRWMTRGFMRWLPSSHPNGCRGLFWPSWGAFGWCRRFVGAFAGDSPPHPDFLFFSW